MYYYNLNINKLKAFHSTSTGDKDHEVVSSVENTVIPYLKRIMDLAKKQQHPDFFVRAFMAYGILHFYDLNLGFGICNNLLQIAMHLSIKAVELLRIIQISL